MSSRSLLGLPGRHSTFPRGLETESGIHCKDPGGEAWFGPMAEQSLLTGYEPKCLIVISSLHTPIIFPSRRNSFRTNINDVPTIATSDDTDTLDAGVTSSLFTQEREVNLFSDSVHQQAAASGSNNTQQPASSNVMHDERCCGKRQRCDHAVRSCGKLQQSDSSDVEKSLLNGKRDRAFGSVSSQEQKNSCLRDKISMIISKEKPGELFKVKAQLREDFPRLNWRDRIIWERRNSDWAAMYGINCQLESQQSELHHANQWACQAQMESRRMFEELTTKSRLYQENHALNCRNIEELRRNCHEGTERVLHSCGQMDDGAWPFGALTEQRRVSVRWEWWQ